MFIGKDWTQTRNYSEEIASLIDSEVRSLIEQGYNACLELLKANRDKLDSIANALIEFEKLDGDTFEKLFSGVVENTAESGNEVTEE